MENTMSCAWTVHLKFTVSLIALTVQILAHWRPVEKPTECDYESIRATLMRIVPLCLDSDPSLIPSSCKPNEAESSGTDDYRDPDDFRFWSERQAKRICVAVKTAFNVEYAPEVVIADANLCALANRILFSKEILTT
jgi:phosphatidylethanolamine N-methyltransferase